MKENDFIVTKSNKKKTGLISFTKLNKFYIIPFIFPFLIYFRYIFLKLSKFKRSGFKSTFQYEFNESLKYLVCGGILYPISYFITISQNKKDKKDKKEEKKEFNSESLSNSSNRSNNNEKIKNRKLKISLILLIMVLAYILFIYNSEILSKNYPTFEIRFYYLIFNTILCKYLLKDNIFKHQLLSLILAFIGWIFLSIPIFV